MSGIQFMQSGQSDQTGLYPSPTQQFPAEHLGQSSKSTQRIQPWSRYERLGLLGRGTFGTTYKVRDLQTNEIFACKLLKRGAGINKNVEREVRNHHQLKIHPNVIGFKEIFLTDEHLGIVQEFAEGGQLFDQVMNRKRFPEGLARFYFQQLICGLSHLHTEGVCHRDLKLENTLISTSTAAPIIKICDFGYCKRKDYDSQPNTTVGTSSYVAPEVVVERKYSGAAADVWSCGVLLYIMLVGKYPFDDPAAPYSVEATLKRVLEGQFRIPKSVEAEISPECVDLLSRIFQPNPKYRIGLGDLVKHPWFQMALPYELQCNYKAPDCRIKPYPASTQPLADVNAILREAKEPAGMRRQG